MKTAQDIIDQVDRQYNNATSVPDKIAMINEALVRLYKDIGLVDIIEISTVENTFAYAIDPSLNFKKIRSFTVSDVPEGSGAEVTQTNYTPLGPDEDLINNSYFVITEGYFGIYPTPEQTGLIIRINYKGRATTITEETDDIELDSDYYDSIAYYVMALIAESNDDIVKYNNFVNTYNSEIRRIKMEEYTENGKYPTTKMYNKKPTSADRRRAFLGNRRSTFGGGEF